MHGPLFNIQSAFGARMDWFGDWQLPADYGDPQVEYQSVRRSVGLLERTPRSFIRVSRSDRIAWLQGMVSNDVRLLESGAPSIQACILNSTGHLLADLRILNFGDHLLLDLDWQNGEKIYQLLEQFLIIEDVELEFDGDLECISLQGPAVTEETANRWAGTEKGAKAFPADHTGDGGYDLYVRTIPSESSVNSLWARLVESGIRPVGEVAAEMLRIESGIPRYGMDMDESVLPLEAGLESTHISHNKGCYVGQEIIHRIHSRGHTNRALTGFRVNGSGALQRNDRILLAESDSEKDVGWITSTTYSPAAETAIALGYLRHEHRVAGLNLVTQSGIRLLVTDLPFFRR